MIRTNEFSFTACSGTNLKHLCNAKFIHTTNSSFPLWPLHCSIHGAKLCHLCTNSSRWLPCSLTLLLVPPVTMVQETPQLSLHRTTPWTLWGTRLGFSYSFTPKLHETALLILRGTLLEEKNGKLQPASQNNITVAFNVNGNLLTLYNALLSRNCEKLECMKATWSSLRQTVHHNLFQNEQPACQMWLSAENLQWPPKQI